MLLLILQTVSTAAVSTSPSSVPATTLPVVSSNHPVAASLPSFDAFLSWSSSCHVHAPANPATPTFAGWLPNSDLSSLTTTLEPLSGNYLALPLGNSAAALGNFPVQLENYPVQLDDHSYADHTPLEVRMTKSVTANSKYTISLYNQASPR